MTLILIWNALIIAIVSIKLASQQKPNPIDFTKERIEKIKKDFENLTLERKNVIKRLQTAREMGDLSENGAYIYAKRELGNTDRQLRQLKYFITYARIIEKPENNLRVQIGHKVTVEKSGKQSIYIITGTQEADPLENQISVVSPLGKALVGHHVGEIVEFNAPAGVQSIKIIAIKS